MGVGSGRSKVSELMIHVFGSVISPDWFAVRQSRRVSRAGWEADVRIIEGGHSITWGSNSSRFTEIVVGSEAAIPEHGRMFHSNVKRDRSTRISPDPRFEYQTCFDAEKLDPEIFAHLSEELTLSPSTSDLVQSYRTANRLAPTALSRLHIEARARGLSVQSFHTFPEEQTIVRVQSLFEIV